VAFRLKGELSGGKTYQEMSVAYEVPKGKSRPDRRYFGSRIEVKINGKIVTTASDSPMLLELLK
jgi:hypothetical protein